MPLVQSTLEMMAEIGLQETEEAPHHYRNYLIHRVRDDAGDAVKTDTMLTLLFSMLFQVPLNQDPEGDKD